MQVPKTVAMLLAVGMFLGLAGAAQAATLTPVAIRASSTGFSVPSAPDIINGNGLTDVGSDGDAANDTHDNNGSADTMWLSGADNTKGGENDEFLIFDLGGVYNVSSALVWNHNQSGGWSRLGVKTMDISATATGTSVNDASGFSGTTGVSLTQGSATNSETAQTEPLGFTGVRFVRFDNFDNYSTAGEAFAGTVGLSEVRFDGVPTPGGPTPTVSWDSVEMITANTDIVNPGGVVEAWNFSNTGSSIDVDVAGTTVTFAPRTAPLPSSGANGSWFNAAGTSVASDFEAVLDSFAWTGTGDTFRTVSFTGLNDGGTYTLQAFLSDDRPLTWNVELDIGGTTTTIYTGAGASTFATATVDLEPGQTSFDLILRPLATGPGGPSTSTILVLNALVLAEAEAGADGDIPEPATMCALGLAIAGLGGYVRKRRRA